jgi:ATP-dependent Clp protease ATP-binding subunit ClpC
MFELFTDRARRVVVLAQEEARMLNHNYIGTEHILLGLIHEGEGVAAKSLESLGISLEAVRQQVEEIIGRGKETPQGHIPFTPRAKTVLELSLRESQQLGHEYIGTEHVLLGLIREGDGVGAQLLVKLGGDLKRVRRQVIQLLHSYSGREPAPAGEPVEPAQSKSPVLDQYGQDLTQHASQGRLGPVIGREKEIERVVQVLCRQKQNNPVLIGEPGVGRTAVVHGLAYKMASGEVPRPLLGKHLYAVDVGMLAASPSQAIPDERLGVVLSEIQDRGDILLFIDDMANTGPQLKPMLARGELQVIGEMTLAGYRDYLASDPAAERTFKPVPVAEPAIPHTIEILKSLRGPCEAHHGVSITDEALTAAAELASRALPGRRLPSKAIDLMDEAASLVQTRQQVRPPDLREYDEKIALIRREKESAIDSQDFAKAAALRDTEKQLLARKAATEKEWEAGGLNAVAEVTEEHVAETLAIMTGLSLDALPSEQQPAKPQLPSAAMTGDDPELWAMS